MSRHEIDIQADVAGTHGHVKIDGEEVRVYGATVKVHAGHLTEVVLHLHPGAAMFHGSDVTLRTILACMSGIDLGLIRAALVQRLAEHWQNDHVTANQLCKVDELGVAFYGENWPHIVEKCTGGLPPPVDWADDACAQLAKETRQAQLRAAFPGESEA